MLVWVLVDNPACQFYAALGGEIVHEQELTIGGKPLIEVAYGWVDIGNLGTSCAVQQFRCTPTVER